MTPLRQKGHSLPRSAQFCCICSFLASLLLTLLCLSAGTSESATESKRRISVPDTIRMVSWVNESYFLGGQPDGPVGLFSPSGAQFVILVARGSIESNANEYSLLLFRTGDGFRTPKPRVVISLSSSSNRPAIRHVKWLTENTILFIGQNRSPIAQVYRFDLQTNRLESLTNSSTAIEAFDISRNGRRLVYEAAVLPKRWLESKAAQRHGIVVSEEDPTNILIGSDCADRESGTTLELFTQTIGDKAAKIDSKDFLSEALPLILSPRGRYAVLVADTRDIPPPWSEYQDKLLHPYMVAKRKPGATSNVNRYMLLDTTSGRLEPLIDAPASWYNLGAAWSNDEQSVIVSGTYLPLGVHDSTEQAIREKHAFVVEVKLSNREITKITDADLKVDTWDQRTGKLLLKPSYSWSKSLPQEYAKNGSNWRAVPVTSEGIANNFPISLTLEEDINRPPKIYVANRNGQSKALLLDLNPQLAQFSLGQVEAVSWNASDGHQVEGGLYLPPGYKSTQRYPLVIQTHGFRKDRFWINGPWNSAFAAQPLAAQGIVVLQVGNATDPTDEAQHVNTPEEALRQMRAYEGAIDYLDARGIIDRHKVGIIGFSRTVLHVAYTLTHSRYEFAAATLADGFDGGYMGYLLWGGPDYVGVNGGAPVGTGMQSWLQNSPSFNLDRIKVPIRLEYYGPWGILGGWSLYSGLYLLNKPVDFVWLPGGTHLLIKPWDRLVSQQGNVDWFCFWLKDKKSLGAEKREQYLRWEHLKELGNQISANMVNK